MATAKTTTAVEKTAANPVPDAVKALNGLDKTATAKRWARLSEQARSAYDKARDETKDLTLRARDLTKSGYAKLDAGARKRPAATLGAGIGVGLGLAALTAFLFKGRKRD